MNLNLVTSGLEELFSKKKKNLILEDEILIKSKNFKYNYNIIQLNISSFYNTYQIAKDFKFFNVFYLEVLEFLSKFLNSYHNLNKKRDFWELIIGCFIQEFISLCMIRWKLINAVLKKYPNIKTVELFTKNESLTPHNNYDFARLREDDFWNYLLNFEILKFHKCQIISSKKKFFYKKNKLKLKNNYFKNFIVRVISYLIKPFKNKIKFFFYKLKINKNDFINLNLKLLQFPVIYNEFDKVFNFKNFKKRKKLLFSNKVDSKFKHFFFYILPQVLPKSYLEGFKEINNYSETIAYEPKVIIGSGEFIFNELFNIWSANKKAKKIYIDHGAVEDHNGHFWQYRAFSKYFSFSKFSRKIEHVPSTLNLKKKKIKFNLGNNILFLSTALRPYVIRINEGYCYNQIKIYENWILFLKNLSYEKENILKVRFHPADKNFKKFFFKSFNGDNASKIFSIEDDIRNSKIVINTSFQTAFFYCMISGTPTILLNDYFFLSKNESLNNLIQIMKKEKIIFNNSNSALKHVREISKSPLDWWNNSKTIFARKKYYEFFALEKDNNMNFFIKKLKKYI